MVLFYIYLYTRQKQSIFLDSFQVKTDKLTIFLPVIEILVLTDILTRYNPHSRRLQPSFGTQIYRFKEFFFWSYKTALTASRCCCKMRFVGHFSAFKFGSFVQNMFRHPRTNRPVWTGTASRLKMYDVPSNMPSICGHTTLCGTQEQAYLLMVSPSRKKYASAMSFYWTLNLEPVHWLQIKFFPNRHILWIVNKPAVASATDFYFDGKRPFLREESESTWFFIYRTEGRTTSSRFQVLSDFRTAEGSIHTLFSTVLIYSEVRTVFLHGMGFRLCCTLTCFCLFCSSVFACDGTSVNLKFLKKFSIFNVPFNTKRMNNT